MWQLLNKLVTGFYRCLGWRGKAPKQHLTPAGNPLPQTVHLVLRPDQLGPGRLILVGDVHGCCDVLLELLRKLEYTPRHDNLMLVGDLVGKGPKSQQTVAAVRAWCKGSYCWVVRGNWDDEALEAYRSLARGQATWEDLNPKFQFVQELLPEDADFLTELPFTIRVEGYNTLVVHAALLPGVPVEAQNLGVCTVVRDLMQAPDGRWIGFEQPEADSQAWAECWQGPCHVFFGHDAKRGLQTAPCATGLDTGCVYGRQLTACVLPPLARLTAQPDAVSQAAPNSSKRHPAGGDHCPVGVGSGSAQAAPVEREQLAAGRLSPVPSLAQLGAELHSVPSTVFYDKKANKKDKKEKKDKNKKQKKVFAV